ncbi:MAG: hypothetical protein ACMUHX_07970 [bacterium]
MRQKALSSIDAYVPLIHSLEVPSRFLSNSEKPFNKKPVSMIILPPKGQRSSA